MEYLKKIPYVIVFLAMCAILLVIFEPKHLIIFFVVGGIIVYLFQKRQISIDKLTEDMNAKKATLIHEPLIPYDLFSKILFKIQFYFHLSTTVYSFDNNTVTKVGKSFKDNVIVIEDKNNQVSRQHLVIEYNEPHLYITDLNSVNGTYINGERLTPNTPTVLNVGDTLTIANANFKYRRM
jgi:uncharacterized membrane protein